MQVGLLKSDFLNL